MFSDFDSGRSPLHWQPEKAWIRVHVQWRRIYEEVLHEILQERRSWRLEESPQRREDQTLEEMDCRKSGGNQSKNDL